MLLAGTACDLLRTFVIPQTLEGAAGHLLGTEVYPADVCLAIGEWGRRFEGEALGMAAANAQFIGAGFNIAPRAAMMDGLLDVQVFTARRREVFRLTRKARTGGHLSDPAVRRFAVAEVRVEAEGGWPVEADGEVLGETPVVFRVQQGLLSLKI